MNKHDLIDLFWEINYFLGRSRQINVTVMMTRKPWKRARRSSELTDCAI